MVVFTSCSLADSSFSLDCNFRKLLGIRGRGGCNQEALEFLFNRSKQYSLKEEKLNQR